MSDPQRRLDAMPTIPTTTELLAFEGEWRRWSGRKDEAIRARFSIPPARYFQLLGRAIDTREAETIDPMLVHALRRVRDDRAAAVRRRLAG